MLQANMQKLEAIVHPLVVQHRNKFMADVALQSGHSIVLFDIPLLFETHAQDQVCMAASCRRIT